MPGPWAGISEPTAHGREHLADADGAQRPEVGPVVDPVRREAVALPVPGDEGDPPALDLADHDVVARVAERGGHPHPLGVVEELVEARAADDADVGA